MSLRGKVAASILAMGIQRLLDLAVTVVVTVLTVRSLPREQYGALSLVMSYGLVFSVIHVSVSVILVRDFAKVRDRIDEYMSAFVLFSVFKGVAALVLTLGIGTFLHQRYGDPELLLVLAICSTSVVALYLTDPFAVLLSVDFHQGQLTRISAAAGVANVVLTLGVLAMPTALFVAVKNAIVTLIVLSLTAWCARRQFRLRYIFRFRSGVRLVRDCLFGFSLWSHVTGLCMDIIYRADLLILGWLNAPLKTVGNYNIALQMSNFTKVFPQILQYNATLGLSRCEEQQRREEITFLFIKYSLLVSLATMGAYLVLGRFAVTVIAATGVEQVYRLGLYMIAGLCLFNAFRPLISYGVVVHDIRVIFWQVFLPSSVATVAAYVVLGAVAGAEGLAKANLFGSVVMSAATVRYIRRKTGFHWRIELLTRAEREFFGKVRRGGRR